VETTSILRNLGNKAVGTVAGNAWTKLVTITAASTKRCMVDICHDPSGASAGTFLYIETVAAGASAPTTAATEVVNVIGSRSTLHIQLSGAIDIYGMNSTGAATTSNYALREYLY